MAQSKSSGSQYALTAIGIGMLIIGVVMAAWTLVPGLGNNQSQGNGSKPEHNGEMGNGGETEKKTQFPVAYVLIGSGLFLILLAVCLNVRQRKKQESHSDVNSRSSQDSPARRPAREESREDGENASRYTIPSYEEVMGADYGAAEGTNLDRNGRMSMSLPSYESLNELDGDMPTASTKADANKGKPARRQSSRLGRALRSFKVRRIKSDKLHIKDFRLKLADKNSSFQTTIEPLTPPPQYDDKRFENLQPTATPP
ncbi:transmembrane protein 51 [Microcaecilia unicolor]|uniref:Transmembrane protein 51 n=1 Tax=Microcaecilia unicolor TaxID=1415580 RepID=A0A6P7WVC1_9AMPH|nr:transmembrane protein 51 [Microcaecilia unicolor]XP_030041812.1 transmembrane protein 51 [Microcaecilia unicolor]XP_030041813.1 transmembrane protein 51 [Microcaecilia unicolor]XP_030041814.1 transmembrane protein 51 [Microcaecilia unicolor]